MNFDEGPILAVDFFKQVNQEIELTSQYNFPLGLVLFQVLFKLTGSSNENFNIRNENMIIFKYMEYWSIIINFF